MILIDPYMEYLWGGKNYTKMWNIVQIIKEKCHGCFHKRNISIFFLFVSLQVWSILVIAVVDQEWSLELLQSSARVGQVWSRLWCSAVKTQSETLNNLFPLFWYFHTNWMEDFKGNLHEFDADIIVCHFGIITLWKNYNKA